MKIALIADTFPPLRTSGAVQLRDLARAFAAEGHAVTVLLPDSATGRPWVLEHVEGYRVLRLRAPRIKDVSYVRRTAGEFIMPFAMLRQLRRSPLGAQKWDGIVWYAPSIFFGPLVKALKATSRCRGYLIIRDIFPEWAVDMGLMGRGLPYRVFSAVARYQYAVADVIGVQTDGNRGYFTEWQRGDGRQLEVLQNWLADTPRSSCSIAIEKSRLAGRKILVYAGNMGAAQGVGIFLDVADRLRARNDIGFLFVGRGRDAQPLAAEAQARGLDNVMFHEEIHPDEIPGLYAQCAAGLLALDPRHRSHNIPGKFLTYMQAGLPVLASINTGNDLAQMIRGARVGRVVEDGGVDTLAAMALELVAAGPNDPGLAERCRNLYRTRFSPEIAVQQVTTALARSR
jgi:glycosyltransferase involved in cell wall biosynthesis